MTAYKARIVSGGRLQIPADVRKELGLADGDDVRLSCPADLPAAARDRIRAMALEAFEAAGCEGLARVDFFYTQAGEIIVNEINTMPGFTPHSMYPQMWAASGVSYPELITELLELARGRRLGLR